MQDFQEALDLDPNFLRAKKNYDIALKEFKTGVSPVGSKIMEFGESSLNPLTKDSSDFYLLICSFTTEKHANASSNVSPKIFAMLHLKKFFF